MKPVACGLSLASAQVFIALAIIITDPGASINMVISGFTAIAKTKTKDIFSSNKYPLDSSGLLRILNRDFLKKMFTIKTI